MDDDLDTNGATRSAVLERIRAATRSVGAPASTDLALWHARHGRAPRPGVGDDVVAAFEVQALRMMCSVEHVASIAQCPDTIARWLDAQQLGRRAVCWSTLRELDWAQAGLDVQARAPNGDDAVGITGAFAAVAETGTLVLMSGPQTPASTHLLPQTHIAIVQASRVVAHYEDAFALMRSELGTPPRAMNLVSGPSRTADIEQTIVLGAHGPFRVHVLIVGAQR